LDGERACLPKRFRRERFAFAQTDQQQTARRQRAAWIQQEGFFGASAKIIRFKQRRHVGGQRRILKTREHCQFG